MAKAWNINKLRKQFATCQTYGKVAINGHAEVVVKKFLVLSLSNEAIELFL